MTDKERAAVTPQGANRMKYYSYQGDPLHLPQVYRAPVLMTWAILWDLFKFKLLSTHRNCAHVQVYLLKKSQ